MEGTMTGDGTALELMTTLRAGGGQIGPEKEATAWTNRGIRSAKQGALTVELDVLARSIRSTGVLLPRMTMATPHQPVRRGASRKTCIRIDEAPRKMVMLEVVPILRTGMLDYNVIACSLLISWIAEDNNVTKAR